MATDLRQTHFRFGLDDGTEITHTFLQNEDTNHTQLIAADWTFLLRFCEQEVGGTAAANTDAQFQYNKNGAGWVDITITSSVVKAVAVNAFANGGHATKRLSGTGTFEASGAGLTEDGSSGGTANDIAASGCSETEAGLQIIFANVANNDTIQFRFTSPDWTITYVVMPTLTITIESLTAVGDTVQGIWNIRQAISDTSQYIYHIRALASDTIQQIWNVRGTIGDIIQHIWNIRSALGDTIQSIWHTRFALGKPVQLIHNVLVAIGDTSQYVWNVLTSVTAVWDTFQLVWHIKQAVGDTTQSIWNVRFALGDAIQSIYNIRQAVPDTIQAIYNVRSAIGDTVQQIWHIRAALWDTLQTIWNTRIMQRFQMTINFVLNQDLFLRAELSRLQVMTGSVSRELSLTTEIKR